MKIQTALISVYDKSNLDKLALFLHNQGVRIISTGGTKAYIEKLNIPVIPIQQITKFPESFNGRLKTINPVIEGGILYERNNQQHLDEIKQLRQKGFDIPRIDLIVVNLYPFSKVIKDPNIDEKTAIENIDIGGSTLIRSASKNYEDVAVVVDPNDYNSIIEELTNNQDLSLQTRRKLMLKAFYTSASYDSQIFSYFNNLFNEEEYSDLYLLAGKKIKNLRYGENSHQTASLYSYSNNSLALAPVYGKRNMSYNNYFDANAALGLIRELRDETAAVIIKHSNPCGGATGPDIYQATVNALKTDPMSAFGGVYAFSRPVDEQTAEFLSDKFIDLILTPGFKDNALEILMKKKKRRIIDISKLIGLAEEKYMTRHIYGGFLVQQNDTILLNSDINNLNIVTKKKPSEKQIKAALFALKFCKHTKSNALVYAKYEEYGQILAVGAGQMSRVDCSRIARIKAKDVNLSLKGSSMASDAFFPFRDTVDNAAADGVSTIIQPGGSIRDQEVIDAANELGISMIFTGIRHFKH